MRRPEWQGKAPSPSTPATRGQGTGPAPSATDTESFRRSPQLAALEARMDPRDIAESYRLAAEAPPLTPGQVAALRSLLGPLMRARRAA